MSLLARVSQTAQPGRNPRVTFPTSFPSRPAFVAGLFVDRPLFYVSIFSEGLNLSYGPAMDQMGETVWLNGGEPIKVILDPVSKTTERVSGGRKTDATAVIYMRRFDFSNNSVSKGDKISVQHGPDLVKMRIGSIEDDGTDLVELVCGPPLKGVVPRR